MLFLQNNAEIQFFQCTIILAVVSTSLKRIGFSKVIYKNYPLNSKCLCFIFVSTVRFTKNHEYFYYLGTTYDH